MTRSAALSLEPICQPDAPASPVERFGADEPLRMDAGVALVMWTIAATLILGA